MAMLLHESLDAAVARAPDKVALVCDKRSYTYAQFGDMVARLALELQHRGVRRGDRVALFLDNSVELAVGVFAALSVGAVFMPVNPLTKADKLAYLLNDSRATAMVTQVTLANAYLQALSRNRSVCACLVVGSTGSDDTRITPYPEVVGGVSSVVSDPGLIDQDLASIIYTSGTTGEPKGVMLTHLNMVSAANSVIGYLGLHSEDVIMCVLPLAFSYGLYHLLMSVRVGATLVIERSFTFPVKVLERMVEHKVSVFPGVPTTFAMLMNIGTLSSHDLSAIRILTNAAAALSEEHLRRVRSLFPRAKFYSMYGLTECKRVSFLPPDQLDVRPASVGRGMPNQEVWLVDEAGRRLPNGSTGELVIRGSHVMRGYWEKTEETAKRLKPGLIAGEMVLHSGDLFRTDDEGYLYFVARKEDIIKSRGEKVSPREVENALYALEGVFEAAVIGVPDELLGQAIKAFVIIGPGFQYSERDVIKHCAGRLENFMAPKYVEFVDALPKTDSGKIKKTGLT